MMLVELTSVPDVALPLAPFKDHLRLASGFSDDGTADAGLLGYLSAAVAAIEGRTGKVLIERDFRWTITDWRDAQRQPLPLAPVNAVIQMVQVDRRDTQAVVPDARYRLVPDHQRPMLCATGATLPAVPVGGEVRVDLMAGFGPEWSDLPADLAQAVLLLAAHFHEYRHEVALKGGSMPYGVTALIERYRTVRLFMGGRT